MRDYASGRFSGMSGRQRVAGRHPGGTGQDRALKLIGVMAVSAMLLGVGSSVWFGMALRDGLSSLDKSRQEQTVLLADNEKLNARRAALLEQDKIEAAAGKLGLYPPSEKQIRRP